MIRFAIVLTSVVGVIFASSAFAFPVAGVGEARAEYNPNTGGISISVNTVTSWLIESTVGDVMTGDEPIGLPAAAGLVTNSNTRIGEAHINHFSYDINLGNVAATNLPNDGTLRIFWSANLGTPALDLPVVFNPTLPENAPPTAGIAGPDAVDILHDPLNVLFDASSTSDDNYFGPLKFQWDLDNNGIFEVDTDTNPTLAVADVTSTFGGFGAYPVSVQVFDGQYTDTATMVINLVPEPSTMMLAGMGLLGMVAGCRRSVRSRLVV